VLLVTGRSLMTLRDAPSAEGSSCGRFPSNRKPLRSASGYRAACLGPTPWRPCRHPASTATRWLAARRGVGPGPSTALRQAGHRVPRALIGPTIPLGDRAARRGHEGASSSCSSASYPANRQRVITVKLPDGPAVEELEHGTPRLAYSHTANCRALSPLCRVGSLAQTPW